MVKKTTVLPLRKHGFSYVLDPSLGLHREINTLFMVKVTIALCIYVTTEIMGLKIKKIYEFMDCHWIICSLLPYKNIFYFYIFKGQFEYSL